jgi:hypothetical protein
MLLKSACIIVLAFLVCIAGCGKGGPQVAPVEGRVTLEGRPLVNADIQFKPGGPERPSSGRTDGEGHYTLMFKRGQPGAIVGPHTVRIWVSPDIVPHPPIIAAKFDAQSELHVEVTQTSNVFDFDVTTEKNAAKK